VNTNTTSKVPLVTVYGKDVEVNITHVDMSLVKFLTAIVDEEA